MLQSNMLCVKKIRLYNIVKPVVAANIAVMALMYVSLNMLQNILWLACNI